MNDSSGFIVSICVQTYNQKDYIEECLDSLLMQNTTFPFEIILGEDESTDGTRELCKEYAAKFPEKIKLFLRSRNDVIYINGSATGRYNFIENLKACTGKYIAICEGDDYWIDPFKLQKQVDFLEANNEYVIYSGFAKLSDSEDKLIGRQSSKGFFELKDFYTQNNIVTCTVMFRNLIKEFPESFYKVKFGDWFLYAMLLHISKLKVYTSNEVFSLYRIHSGGTMVNLTRINHFKAHIDQIKHLRKYLKFNFKFKKDINNINVYLRQIFELEMSDKNYLRSLNAIFLNFRYVGFKMPYNFYLKTVGKKIKKSMTNFFKMKI